MTQHEKKSGKRRMNNVALAIVTLTVAVGAFCLALPYATQPLGPTTQHAPLVAGEQTVASGDPQPKVTENSNDVYVDGSVIVTFEDGVNAGALNAALSRAESVNPQQITQTDVENGFAELSIRDGQTVETAVAELEKLQGIDFSQPNYLYYLLDEGAGSRASGPQALTADTITALSTTPNDEKQSRQWYLDEEHGINAFKAWDLAKSEESSTPITIAVIDSGCNLEHEDLEDNALMREGVPVTYDATPSDTEDDKYEGSGMSDISDNGHGTHVCGTVAATANNDVGIAGVSYNAKFLPIQVFRMFETDSGPVMSATTGALLKAYAYVSQHAAEYNIKVVNMSIGANRGPDNAILRQIENAYEKGVLPVCAAGNYNLKLNPPLTVPYTIFPGDFLNGHGLNVIALDKNHNRPEYSNYNAPGKSTKDIAAPGGTSISGGGIYSTLSSSPDAYGELFGTSMAAPVASGAATLVFAANPSLSPGQVIDIVHATAKDLGEAGRDEDYGFGLIDAYHAVAYAQSTLEGAGDLLVGQAITLRPSNAADQPWDWNTSKPGVATVDNGTVTGVSAGQATITATRGSFSISKNIVVYSASVNGDDTVEVGSSTTLTLSAAPAGGTWSWSSSDEGVARVVRTTLGATATGVSAGTATITAELSTNPDVKATFPITVAAKAPEKPPITEIELQGASSLLMGSTILLAPSITGSFSWTSSNSRVATVDNGVVTGVSAGQATITASNDGASGTKTIVVYEAAISGNRTIKVSEGTALSLSAAPAGGTWSWSSSDEGVARVVRTTLGATATGVSAGTATITAELSTNPDVKATFPITVVAVEPDPDPDPDPDPEPKSEPEPAPGLTPAPAPDPKPDPTPTPAPDPKTDPDPAPDPKPDPDPEPKSEPELEPEPAPAPEPDPKPDPAPEPKPDPEPEKPGTSKAPALPEASNPSITVSGGPFVFTGSPITPTATVKAGGRTLSYGTDYLLSYANATNSGSKAVITAKGINQYKDRLRVSTYFTIAKAPQTISVKTASCALTAKSLKARDRSVHCIKQVKGKKGRVTFKKKSGSAKLSINKTTGLVTVRQGTKKGTYKLKIAVVAKESQNFKKSNTVTKTLKIKVK